MWTRGWVADPRVGGGVNVLLVLMIVTSMLGLSTEGYVTPVRGVINYSSRKVILIGTSRVPTWERNRTTAMIVVKTFHRKLDSSYTTGAYTRARNHTAVLIAVKTSHRKLISYYTYGVYTMERNPTSVLSVGEGLGRGPPFTHIIGLYTMVRSLTNVLIAVKLSPVSRV